MDNKRKISAEEVIAKIKDDGDFDRLRLKIIRKIKDDGELRDSIVAMVKQSAALNRLGAESMKPRQLSDAIHQEIGNKVMSQISDGIWTILRSGDEMKTEITETVQTVYSKLMRPEMNENGGSSSGIPVHERHNESVAGSINEIHEQSEAEANEPPGFSRNDRNYSNGNNNVDHTEERPRRAMPCNGKVPIELEKLTSSTDGLESSKPLLHFPEAEETMVSNDDDADDDPDVPPGFG